MECIYRPKECGSRARRRIDSSGCAGVRRPRRTHRHALAVGGDDPTGTPIVVTGDALDESYFRVNVGLALILTKGRSGFVQYDRIFGRDGNSQDNLSLGFRVEF